MPSSDETTQRRSSASRPPRPVPSTLPNVRVEINQLFSGRSSVRLQRSLSPESPKTPRLALGLQNLPSTRIHIPYLNRTSSTNSSGSTRPNTAIPRPARNPTSFSSRPITPRARQEESQNSPYTTLPLQVRRSSGRRFVGDPAELHLAEIARVERRRRRHKSRNRRAERRCGPKIRNRKIRQKILSCFVSGLVSCQWTSNTLSFANGI